MDETDSDTRHSIDSTMRGTQRHTEQVNMLLRSLLFTVIFGAVVALKDPSLDMHWLLWKKNHSKTYTSELEEFTRS
ncbi:hypothetical protein PHYPO_G00006420 [Pangasianodon hypophthalmus]|uniref:Uncharacterized protein n=1 Tax=Pangasianodon hypophthalmus TaxID=310915 RepID=A0A5N5Q4I3_PANHP|nr:hypothetical protein PHYPO_G00006420 [Pangasianodon hypophthalmus]